MARYRDTASTADLAQTAELRLLDEKLASDLERSVREALSAGAVFPAGCSDPLAVFRNALAGSIRDIEHHPRGQLVQSFLLKGPYEDSGEIPPDKATRRMSDAEVAATTAFVFSFMVNSFKGSLVELLACAPCVELVRTLQDRGNLPPSAQLFVGDSVTAATSRGSRFAQAADLHILKIEDSAGRITTVDVAGVVEVKSYPLSQRRVRKQLSQHLSRAALGLRVGDQEIEPARIRTRPQQERQSLRIAVVPSRWKLPRTLSIGDLATGHLVHTHSPEPPTDQHKVEHAGDAEWRITLRWSQEAIASAAYGMTFWYMEKVGEVIYRAGVPRDWVEMTPAEAARNAVKMMLHYSILRTRSLPEEQRAIALYNTYGFGYALGMSFRNPNGRREMLWFEDLEEIAASGVTKEGCSFK